MNTASISSILFYQENGPCHVAQLLARPVTIFAGRSFDKAGKEFQPSLLQKIVAVAVTILLLPIALPAISIGLVTLSLSCSHKEQAAKIIDVELFSLSELEEVYFMLDRISETLPFPPYAKSKELYYQKDWEKEKNILRTGICNKFWVLQYFKEMQKKLAEIGHPIEDLNRYISFLEQIVDKKHYVSTSDEVEEGCNIIDQVRGILTTTDISLFCSTANEKDLFLQMNWEALKKELRDGRVGKITCLKFFKQCQRALSLIGHPLESLNTYIAALEKKAHEDPLYLSASDEIEEACGMIDRAKSVLKDGLLFALTEETFSEYHELYKPDWEEIKKRLKDGIINKEEVLEVFILVQEGLLELGRSIEGLDRFISALEKRVADIKEITLVRKEIASKVQDFLKDMNDRIGALVYDQQNLDFQISNDKIRDKTYLEHVPKRLLLQYLYEAAVNYRSFNIGPHEPSEDYLKAHGFEVNDSKP